MALTLITTALGNVGKHVVRACQEQGLALRLADRKPAACKARYPQHEAAALDFTDPSTWEPAVRGCDHVFLLRPPPIGDMERTLNPFIDAAYASGVKHIVFLSVAGADRMKWVPHHKVEQKLAECGKSYTLLRPGFFAQNLQDAYLRDIKEDNRIYVPAGGGKIAFLDVYDVGDVAARVFNAPNAFVGKALHLTGPEAVTFFDVAQMLSSRLGRVITYRPASIPGYAWHLRRKRRMPWTQILVQTILHVGLRRGDAEMVSPVVQDILGRAPRSLGTSIDSALDLWKPTASQLAR